MFFFHKQGIVKYGCFEGVGWLHSFSLYFLILITFSWLE